MLIGLITVNFPLTDLNFWSVGTHRPDASNGVIYLSQWPDRTVPSPAILISVHSMSVSPTRFYCWVVNVFLTCFIPLSLSLKKNYIGTGIGLSNF